MSRKVLTFGVFDYFHLGHLRFLKECRKLGDELTVAVEEDRYVLKFRPEIEMLYTTAERVELIEALKAVDRVIVYDTVSAETLSGIDFDILALGENQTEDRFRKAEEWCRSHGKEVVRLKRTEGISAEAEPDGSARLYSPADSSSDLTRNFPARPEAESDGYAQGGVSPAPGFGSRSGGRQMVLTFGVFDFFHLGHLRLFKNAAKLGDGLTVAVQEKDYVLRIKPESHIIYSLEARMELVSSLKVVDRVISYQESDRTIRTADFDIFAIGEDQNHAGFQRAVRWCEEHNKKVVRMHRTEGICSSDIKRRMEEMYESRISSNLYLP